MSQTTFINHSFNGNQTIEEKPTVEKEKSGSLSIVQKVYNYDVKPSDLPSTHQIPTKVSRKGPTQLKKLQKRQKERLEEIDGVLELGFVELPEKYHEG